MAEDINHQINKDEQLKEEDRDKILLIFEKKQNNKEENQAEIPNLIEKPRPNLTNKLNNQAIWNPLE